MALSDNSDGGGERNTEKNLSDMLIDIICHAESIGVDLE